MKARDDVDMIRVNGDDVRVLQQGQSLRLARADARNLEGDRAIGEVPLEGEEDPGHSPSAQLLDQPEAADGLAGPRKRDGLLLGPFA